MTRRPCEVLPGAKFPPHEAHEFDLAALRGYQKMKTVRWGQAMSALQGDPQQQLIAALEMIYLEL
jgi:hypothetical protein